jgi:hypothetical protein
MAARKSWYLTRKRLAFLAGVDAAAVKRVELGRAVLKYRLGSALCQETDSNQAWLCSGAGAKSPRIYIASGLEEKIPPDMSFSGAFSEHIWPSLNPEQQRAAKSGSLTLMRAAFVKPIGFSSEEEEEWSDGRRRARAHDARAGVFHLTDAATQGSIELVNLPTTLEDLRQEINRRASAPGVKTQLAEFLGAPLASVSRWLSGDRDPGGETTLRMLNWVVEQERKKR